MIEGKKVRGSDTGLNLIIIGGIFHNVSPDLVSFEMILTGDEIKNIYCIGYSKHLKELFIMFRNEKRYIYQNVSLEKWQSRHSYEKLNQFYSQQIQGLPFYNTTDSVRPITNECVLEAYNKLEYYQTITEGLFCTDRPDKIIDPENLLFQLNAD